MIDVIADAANALKGISNRDIVVMQGWYKKDIKHLHITLWDLGEVESGHSDDDAEGMTLGVQVTIFSQKDEVELAREVKHAMKESGFLFEGRNPDEDEPQDGIYMKAQRFSKYYEED